MIRCYKCMSSGTKGNLLVVSVIKQNFLKNSLSICAPVLHLYMSIQEQSWKKILVAGGLTRLTESGLSMVELSAFGERPPLSHDDWVREFEKYQEYPEYKL